MKQINFKNDFMNLKISSQNNGWLKWEALFRGSGSVEQNFFLLVITERKCLLVSQGKELQRLVYNCFGWLLPRGEPSKTPVDSAAWTRNRGQKTALYFMMERFCMNLPKGIQSNALSKLVFICSPRDMCCKCRKIMEIKIQQILKNPEHIQPIRKGW